MLQWELQKGEDYLREISRGRRSREMAVVVGEGCWACFFVVSWMEK